MSVLALLLAWLPQGHPLAGTSEDGCSVQVPAVTVVSAESESWSVAWDVDGDGAYDREELHYRRRGLEGWYRYGAPMRFPVEDVVLRWRVTFPEPSPSAVALPYLALCPPSPSGGYECVLERSDTVIKGQSLYSRRVWELGRDHPRLGAGRLCPELEEVQPLPSVIFSDGFESGNASAWSRAVNVCLFCDDFENGNAAAWSRSVP